MHVKRLLITIIAAIYAAAMVCIATPESDLRATDSLYVLLKTAKTPADSLPLLYDLYDLGSRQDKAMLNRVIYPVAKRMGNVTEQAELLRKMASFIFGMTQYKSL